MGFVIFIMGVAILAVYKSWVYEKRRKSRQDYYRNIYLKSEAWQRKRYVVLKRDNWQCVHCGAKATQVHHKKYAKYKIGKEPIDWLESTCFSCHEKQHLDLRIKK